MATGSNYVDLDLGHSSLLRLKRLARLVALALVALSSVHHQTAADLSTHVPFLAGCS